MTTIKNHFEAGILAIATVFALVFFVLPTITHAAMITQTLSVGSTGSEVTSLQTFLATDRSIYPQGLVTGYFGSLTKAAVTNFQIRNNIDAVGIVGPITRPVINAQMASGMTSTVSDGLRGQLNAPAILNVGVSTGGNTAIVSWNTDESAKGIVYYGTSPLTLTENVNVINVSGGSAVMTDTAFRTSQNVSLQGLTPNTTYYYAVYSTNQANNSSVSWPATFRTTN